MKRPTPAECRRARDVLLDRALDPPSGQDLPPSLEEHFRTCAGCRKYRKGVLAAAEAALPEPLYTSALKRRTLAALETERDRPLWLAPLLLPTSTASLAALLLPVWLLTHVLHSLFGSDWLSAGVALALFFSAGLAAAGLGLAVLVHRRGIRPTTAASGRPILEASHE